MSNARNSNRSLLLVSCCQSRAPIFFALLQNQRISFLVANQLFCGEQLRSAYFFLCFHYIFFYLPLSMCVCVYATKPATANNSKSNKNCLKYTKLEIIGFFSFRIIVTSCKCTDFKCAHKPKKNQKPEEDEK